MPILAIGILFMMLIIGNKQSNENTNVLKADEEKTIRIENETEENTIKDTNELENSNVEVQNWQIEIPAISLLTNISDGTDEETLNGFVGHFEITPKTEGNIGLAAHNRGYPVNYFENLKELEGGEEIIYTYGEFTKTYVVTQNIKISDIDWSYLENSSENKITLITCIENEPAYRRCVQAIEKEEE